mgnify:CR=1 FL=1
MNEGLRLVEITLESSVFFNNLSWKPALINEGLRPSPKEHTLTLKLKWKPALINEGLRLYDP